MRSNICKIENGTRDLDEILQESERVAEYNGLYLMLYIYGVDGDYYLDICDYVDDVENHKWHKIKPEYVALLTSAISKAE